MKSAVRSIVLGLLTLLVACSSGLEAPVPTLETQVTSTTLKFPVISPHDDIEEISGGAMQLSGGLLDFNAKSGISQTVGLRFQNVAIPYGAVIENAYLSVKGGAADAGSVTLELRAEASDHAPVFTSTKNNLGNRAKTVATSLWQPNAWAAGKLYQSGNLSAIVQEVINRPGWKSGNSLALSAQGVAGTGERSAIAYGANPANAPALVVTFSGGGIPPVEPELPITEEPEPENPAPGSTTLNVKVAVGLDDLEERNGTIIADSVLEFYVMQKVGLRFANLDIPQDATITAATLSFTAAAAGSGAAQLTVRAQSSDNAPAFSKQYNNLSSRQLTSASATWQPESWSINQTVRSPELKTLVQEVVTRPNWQRGNALAFIFSKATALNGATSIKRSAAARDAGEAKAPVLTISYTLPTDPTDTTDPADPTDIPDPSGTTDPTNPTDASDPTDSTDATDPSDTTDPTNPGTPSADQSVWLARLKSTITNPKYDKNNAWMDPKKQAASGNLFVLGRDFGFYTTALTLAYRETGDRLLMEQLDTVMNIAKSTLDDYNGDGYRNWLYLHFNGDSSGQQFINTDEIRLEEVLTHAMVANAAYALKQAGFSSSAAFWTDYLKNDFEAKWRVRSKKPSGFPFIHHFLMHPTTQLIRYHYYMYKLTGDSNYLGEARRLATAVKATIREDGTWAHEVGKSTGCQPAPYVPIFGQALADLATNGSGLIDNATMTRAAGAVSRNLIRNYGMEVAGTICGVGTRGTLYAFVSRPFSQLARWDESGYLRQASEISYAATEKGREEAPRIYNLPAVMVFALGK